jgi:hypothetical protein
MLPIEILALIEDEEEHETLGPCGCSDYHMADCSVRTAQFDDDHERYDEIEQSWDIYDGE